MVSFMPKKKEKYRHPAFNGLNDKELAAIYGVGNIRTVSRGEKLFGTDQKDQNTYLIMGGQLLLQVSSQLQNTSMTLGQGEVLASRLLSEEAHRTAAAFALEDATVFEFNDQALSGVAEGTQLLLVKNLEKIAGSQINHLMGDHLALREKNVRLTSQITSYMKARTAEYSSSAMIQGVLKKVPKLPPYASKLTVLLMDENASTKEVVDLAKLDPSLTAAVLKTVNSAYYGLRHDISDFQHAALLLGFNQIFQLILDIGVRSTMPKTREFHLLQFHSMMISILASEISQLSGSGNPALVGTIGMLHDIGQSVTMLLKQQNPKMAFLIDHLDHGKIGSLLLKEWKIPDSISEALSYAAFPEMIPPEFIPESQRTNAALIYLAHQCYEKMMGADDLELASAFLPDYLELVGIQETDMLDFLEKKLVPAMVKRLNSYPQSVQKFIMKYTDMDVEDFLENTLPMDDMMGGIFEDQPSPEARP